MEIELNDFLKINNPNIIDIRSLEKYNEQHIPNSININYSLLITNPEEYLNKNETYYIYCQKGITSKKVVQMLKVRGYKVISIIGGYEKYILQT